MGQAPKPRQQSSDPVPLPSPRRPPCSKFTPPRSRDCWPGLRSRQGQVRQIMLTDLRHLILKVTHSGYRTAGDHPRPEWTGLFKERVSAVESRCGITGVDNPVHLVASHCRPWRASTNEERLNGENGLLLTPSIDHLFDRGFIGFVDNRHLIISPVAGLPYSTCCHTFRATGITTYMQNGGTLEHAQQIAAHESPRTAKLYDRTQDEISLDDEVERIRI